MSVLSSREDRPESPLFAIGYNGAPDFVEGVVDRWRDHISCVYAVPAAGFGVPNARTRCHGSPLELLRLRTELARRGLPFELVFNFDTAPALDQELIDRVVSAANFLQPDVVTFSNTFLLDVLSEHTEFPLNVSVIHDVDSTYRLDMLLARDSRSRIASILVGRGRTFDLDWIRRVRRGYPGLRLRVLLNEGCMFECPDQNFHSCSTSIGAKLSETRPIFYCWKLAPHEHWRFLAGQYVPPRFVRRYAGIAHDFKLSTRILSTPELGRVLDEYVRGEDVTIARAMVSARGGTGFLRPIGRRDDVSGIETTSAEPPYAFPYPESFFDRRSTCDHDCRECGYCEGVLAAGLRRT